MILVHRIPLTQDHGGSFGIGEISLWCYIHKGGRKECGYRIDGWLGDNLKLNFFICMHVIKTVISHS